MSMDGTLYVTSEDNKVFTLAHDDLRDVNMEAEFNDNTLTVYVKRLREKIEDDPSKPRIIQTVRGIGYRVIGDD